MYIVNGSWFCDVISMQQGEMFSFWYLCQGKVANGNQVEKKSGSKVYNFVLLDLSLKGHVVNI